MSHDLLQMVSKEQHLIQTPIVTLLEHIKSITSFGKGVAAFAGLQVTLITCDCFRIVIHYVLFACRNTSPMSQCKTQELQHQKDIT